MSRVKAWEQLEDREYCGSLNMEAFHDLLLKAGWSADEAQKAASQRGWERLSAGEVL